ncbi:hypothetical protein AHiyo1_04430 [Arthrobacter sp. Hiyo1]|nr:hypothetical protein AHiyo1_04430 [Arthrobacter sp. Hiyo1]
MVEASQPQRPAVAWRMRSSLKTVISVPSPQRPSRNPALWAWTGRPKIFDGNRMSQACQIDQMSMKELIKIFKIDVHR